MTKPIEIRNALSYLPESEAKRLALAEADTIERGCGGNCSAATLDSALDTLVEILDGATYREVRESVTRLRLRSEDLTLDASRRTTYRLVANMLMGQARRY